MATRMNQMMTEAQLKELHALDLSPTRKKDLEVLLSVKPRNWESVFSKGLDTLFKEISRCTKQKLQQKRKDGSDTRLKVEEALIILNTPVELQSVMSQLQYQLWRLLMAEIEETDESEDEGIQDSQPVEKGEKEKSDRKPVIQGCEEITDESEDEGIKEKPKPKEKEERSSSSSSDEDEEEPKKSSSETSSSNESDEEEKSGGEEKKESEKEDSDTFTPVDELIEDRHTFAPVDTSPPLETPKMPTLPTTYKIPKVEEDLPSKTLESLKKGKCASYCGQFIFHSFSFYRRREGVL